MVPFVVCRGRRAIFLRRAVHDGRKKQVFQDHRAVGFIMSFPSLSTRKRIGRGVRNIDSGVGDRETKNAVLSGPYAKFTENPDI